MDDLENATKDDPGDGWEWAIVEIFGHRRHAGRCREEERFGAKMLRVDIPNKGDPAAHGWTTHFYGGSSIFSYSLTDEVSALKANKPYDSPYRMIAPPDDEPEDPTPDDDEGDYVHRPGDDHRGDIAMNDDPGM